MIKPLLKPLKQIVILLFILLESISALAQEKKTPIKFGKVSMEEMTMPVYKLDSSANAVVLSDVGTAYFQYNNSENGFEIVYQRHTRIKVFNKAGYDAATISIPYYNSFGKVKEKVMTVKGTTYLLENGKIIEYKLDSKSIFDEKTTDNWSQKKFTLPNVKEGAVFEFVYTINSNYLFAFPTWKFQGEYPVIWSEYNVRIPEYFKYKQAMQGYESLAINEEKQNQDQFSINYSGSIINHGSMITERIAGGSETMTAQSISHRWAMKDVPAFKDEKFITTDEDYLAKIEFQLTGTQFPNSAYKPILSSWEAINEELLFHEKFGAQLNRSGFAKDELKAIEAKFNDPISRIIAVSRLVKKNVKWNGSNSVYSSNGIKDAYEKKLGNSADINLMLISFLREVGLKADPVIISTRSHGRVKEYHPMLEDFNSVIACVQVDSLEFLLDGTNPFIPVHLLPEQCLNGTGRVITKADGRWIELEGRHDQPRKSVLATASIDNEGHLKGNLAITEQLYDAARTRSALAASSQEEYIKKTFTSEALKINKYSFENVEKIDTMLVTKLELEGEQQEMADMIYVNPYLLFTLKENPFKAKDRKFPVSYTVPQNETYLLTFTIPKGYVVEELPKSAIITLPEGSAKFTYQAAYNEEKIQLRSTFSINKTMFLPDEYQDLKQFYSVVIAKQAEQIILKKATIVNSTGK